MTRARPHDMMVEERHDETISLAKLTWAARRHQMNDRMTNQSSGTAANVQVWTHGTSTRDTVVTSGDSSPRRSRPGHKVRDVERAVYAHIQALRALGQTTVNSVEISRALSLPLDRVEGALRQLQDKGVRIVE